MSKSAKAGSPQPHSITMASGVGNIAQPSGFAEIVTQVFPSTVHGQL